MKRIIIIFCIVVVSIIIITNSKNILKLGFPRPYINIVTENITIDGVDEMLVYSVIRAESRFDENAISYADAKGLMQISDDTFDTIRNNISINDDVFDPSVNIRAGIWYLNNLFGILNDLDKTVMAYNCGLNNLDKKITQTLIFHERVFEFYNIYKNLYLDRSSN